MTFPFVKSEAMLRKALDEKQCSAVACIVEKEGKQYPLYLGKTAHKEFLSSAAPVDENTIFDLASLTKILSTLCLLLVAESEERLSFSDPVQKYFPNFKNPKTTLENLLNHNSGLKAHFNFFERYNKGEAKFGDLKTLALWICESEAGTPGNTEYSDLGFMLLGIILEKIYGKKIPEIFHDKITKKLKLQNTGFVPLTLKTDVKKFAATENCAWRKKIVQGEVHDDNASTMGGYGGHAGLFSNASEALKCFHHLLKQVESNPSLSLSPTTKEKFYYGLMVYPGLRAHPGNAFPQAIGHTGFVGTSIWHHEATKTNIVLLTNRVHPSRDDGRWIQTRLEFHQSLWDELFS